MSVTELVSHYGYIAVAVGCLLEGETVLLTAGFAAHRGMLDLPAVLAVAFVASALGDQIFFQLGRHQGPRLKARFPALARNAPRVDGLLARHHTLLILGIRFMVGLRVAGPILMGSVGIAPLRFTMLNLTGAALWATAIGSAGYAFGAVIQTFLRDLRHLEEGILVALLVVTPIVLHLFHRWRSKRQRGD